VSDVKRYPILSDDYGDLIAFIPEDSRDFRKVVSATDYDIAEKALELACKDIDDLLAQIGDVGWDTTPEHYKAQAAKAND